MELLNRESPIKKLNISSIFIAGIVCIAVLSSAIVITQYVNSLKYDAEIINISGKQRLLIQQVATHTLHLIYTESLDEQKKELNDLNEYSNLLFGGYSTLSKLVSDHKFSSKSTQYTVDSLLTELGILHSKLDDHLNVINNLGFASNEETNSFEHVAAITDLYLVIANNITVTFKDDSIEKLAHLKWISYILLSVIIGITFFVYAFLYTPLRGYLITYFEDLQNTNQILSQANIELSETKEFLAMTTEVADIGGWKLDLKTKTLFWSDLVKKIHEVDSDFKPDLDTAINFYTPEGQKTIEQSIEHAIATGKPYDVELQIITHKNRLIWIRSRGKAKFENNTCVALMGTFQDIDAQKRNSEELEKAKEFAEQASKAKSEFLANMSHEIRTPLNSVIGFTELMESTNLDDDQVKFLGYINQSANSLLDLINDILDFSKIEAGRLEISTEKVDVWDLVEQIITIIRGKTNEKGLELLLDISPSIPRYFYIDPIRIRQVLINLLSNAVKFTHKGFVHLKIEELKEHTNDSYTIRFSVTDTGIGIGKNDRQRIFESFVQEDLSTTKQFGGTGLGLSISNNLLKMMDSHLEVSSERGKGSCFFFDMVVQAEHEDPAQTAIDEQFIASINHVLVVDDNVNNGKILSGMLRQKDIPHTVVNNGMDALNSLSKKHSDIVIMDNEMPFMSGMETISKIRTEIGLGPEVVNIILLHSFSNDIELNAKSRSLGVFKTLNKPITMTALFNILHSIGEHEIISKPAIEPIKEESEATENEPKILIVDDNPINRELTSSFILNNIPNVKIGEAVNGKEAVVKVLKGRWDLILMDIQMPEMNGYEASRHIRSLKQGGNVPIIALTAGALKNEAQRCMDAGMNGYLSKPISKKNLIDTLSKWISEPKSQEDTPQEESTNAMENHFNMDAFLQKHNGDKTIVSRLINHVLEGSFSHKLQELKALVNQPEKESDILIVAHEIKGVAYESGFEVLGDLADTLLNLAPYSPELASKLVTQMQEEHDVILHVLQTQQT